MGAPLVAPGAVRCAGARRGLRRRPAPALVPGTGPSRDGHRPRPAGRAGGGPGRRSHRSRHRERPLAPGGPHIWRRGGHELPLAAAAAHHRGQRGARGVLLYETFACGNETVGRPARPDFLLRPGELLSACTPLRVVAYEDGFLDGPARFVQRITAVRVAEDGLSPARHPLRTLS